MKTLLVLLAIGTAATATWVGDEYWTVIDSSGRPRGSIDNFAKLDGEDNKYVAFWITRSKYPGEHFEAFGTAYEDGNGRVCASFAGFYREHLEICGGFRVLSVPQRYQGHNIFAWVPSSQAETRDTIGYLAHRIAKAETDGAYSFVYGDAIPSRRSFIGGSNNDIVLLEDDAYLQKVSLLRLTVPEEAYRQPPRLPPPPPPPAPLREFICDQNGTPYEKTIRDGRVFYVEYDERVHGRRPHCPYVAPVVYQPVEPRPDPRPLHAILPDHHDANGQTIADVRSRRRLRKSRRSTDE